jgi:hypothetical protein
LNKTLASGSESRLPTSFIALLLLSTFALSAHVQLARYDRLATFPAKHILHGDLRPDCDNYGQLFAEVDGAAHFAFAVGVLLLASRACRLIAACALPSCEPSVRKVLKYLSLFFRPPPY